MIDRKTVEKVASLARLKLSDSEVDSMTASMTSILGYIEQLGSVDTSAVEPTCFIVPQHDPLRDDLLKPSLTSHELLANGPSVKNNHFAVPKVISQ